MLNFCVAVQDFLVLSYLEECLGKERKNTATGDTGGHPGELVLSTHSLFQHLRAIMHVTAVPKAQLSCMTCTSISKFQQITLTLTTIKQPFFPTQTNHNFSGIISPIDWNQVQFSYTRNKKVPFSLYLLCIYF